MAKNEGAKKQETNFMYVALEGLDLDVPEQRAVLKAALDHLNVPFEGRAFEEIYETTERHFQNVFGLLILYEDYMEDVLVREKRRRADLDIKLSQAKNPATNKAYTRDAISSLIEIDEEGGDDNANNHIIGLTNFKSSIKNIINFLRKLNILYDMHSQRIVNVNVNARRAWQHQG